ncbi:unnamed protein product [Withania somnifera]
MALAIRAVVCTITLVAFQQIKVDAHKHQKLGEVKKCRFDKIYQLCDSLSDTGNCIKESLCGANSACSRLPYGMNLFQKATARCSDGMLMIDFIAVESGLPLFNPYKDQNANFSHGANFAVAGATALSAKFLTEKNIQLDWMDSHFRSTCFPDCRKNLKSSLFLVGEIGGNDFNYGLWQGKTMEELRRMVPDAVHTIIHGVKKVIGFGATRIVVPGNFPIGCIPAMLTKFMTNNTAAYDEYHCLKDLNDFYPNITLIYGDYYNAFQWLLQHSVSLGFEKNSLQKACCGIGGKYNYDISTQCGAPGVAMCVDPSTYISWDGTHLTQAAYKWLARWLIHDMLPQWNCHDLSYYS